MLIEQTLKDSELRYRRLFETAQDGILILDAETGMIEDVNPFLIKMLNYSHEEFIKKRLWEVGAFKDVDASQDAFQALQKNEYIRYENLPLRAKDGKLIHVEFVSNVYMVEKKRVVQCNIRDITERKLAQDALLESESLLREMSVRDHLTGLFNRRYMEETLEREIIRASRKNVSLGIIMIDVDNFKRFNDKFGHAAGDLILNQLGKLFLEHIRGEDIACRYGGDEFIIVMPDTSREIVYKRAELICESIPKINFQFEGQTLETVTLSLGIAVFPEDGYNRADIMEVVDKALYKAKHSGRNRVTVAKRKLIVKNNPNHIKG
jgi:diguanylate cyclase (GGDEF)-like protein/PAS domain S-box-containing protein